MRWLVVLAIVVLAQLPAGASRAVYACAREDIALAVDRAGAALRQLNTDNTPRLRSKMRALKDTRGWPDAGFEEKAYEVLQDERMAALDMQANDLLAKLDTLGTVDPAAEPDCTKLQELTATSLELQATVKAKAAYTLAKLDQMLGGPSLAPEPKGKSAEVRPSAPAQPTPKPAARPPDAGSWTPKPAPPAEIAIAPKPPAPPPAQSAPPSAVPTPVPPLATGDDEGYTIDEIMAASDGFFGKVSANLGSVIEHLFKKSGRPTGYILGTEGGGAFLAGLRYGKGTLYVRAGSTQTIFWHGPSLGTDVGVDGSKTLFLIYRLKSPDAIYASFAGVDGSAYFVGGVGATLVTNGSVIVAPIRSGVGLRLGANIGYIRFTERATWKSVLTQTGSDARRLPLQKPISSRSTADALGRREDGVHVEAVVAVELGERAGLAEVLHT